MKTSAVEKVPGTTTGAQLKAKAYELLGKTPQPGDIFELRVRGAQNQIQEGSDAGGERSAQHRLDVAVDLRQGSATFGRWFGAELSDCGPRQIYMPPGFAHGFCVLSEMADLHYKVSRYYSPQHDLGLLWNDPSLGIAWPVGESIGSTISTVAPLLMSAWAIASSVVLVPCAFWIV